jgi:hypothetical protein
MLAAEFEPAIPEIERPQTYALYRTAKGIGTKYYSVRKITEEELGWTCSTHENH